MGDFYKKVASLPDERESEKICLLWQQLSNPTGSDSVKYDSLLDREIYPEMYHKTGELWTNSSEVIHYLTGQQCQIEADSPEKHFLQLRLDLFRLRMISC